jgi:transglutaminase superfamily protein
MPRPAALMNVFALQSAVSATLLFVRACFLLLHFERCIQNHDFSAVYREVRSTPVAESDRSASGGTERICHSVDLACVWYWRQVLCLQRSAVTCCLLKRSGIAARLVVGVRQLPFRAHAWVELNGAIVNDRPYLRDMYAVVDEC